MNRVIKKNRGSWLKTDYKTSIQIASPGNTKHNVVVKTPWPFLAILCNIPRVPCRRHSQNTMRTKSPSASSFVPTTMYSCWEAQAGCLRCAILETDIFIGQAGNKTIRSTLAVSMLGLYMSGRLCHLLPQQFGVQYIPESCLTPHPAPPIWDMADDYCQYLFHIDCCPGAWTDDPCAR